MSLPRFLTNSINIFLSALILCTFFVPFLAAENLDTIKIVSSFPRHGSINLAVEPLIKSFKMALDEADYKAGNYNIVYEDWNNADEEGRLLVTKESENAQKAVLDSDVMVYLGPDPSGAVAVALPILNAANLVMISPTSTYAGFTKTGTGKSDEPQKYQSIGHPTFARVIPTNDMQGAMAALWAEQLNVKSVYVLSDGGLYGNQLADLFIASAKTKGLEIKNQDQTFEIIDLKGADFKTLAGKINNLHPDLVFVGINASNRAGQLWQDLRAASQDDPFILMAGDNLTVPPFLDEAGVAAEGTYIITGGIPLSVYKGAAAEFVERYREKYKEEPTFYAIYAYEVMKVALDAIARSSKSRADIRDAVFSTQNFNKGAMNSWGFDPNGDIFPNTMSILQVLNGNFEFVTELKN